MYLPELCEDVVKFAKQQNLDKVNLVGHRYVLFVFGFVVLLIVAVKMRRLMGNATTIMRTVQLFKYPVMKLL